jgi:hypothetical protein
MAYSRQTFKNRVEEKIGGALLDFYKAECAEANGQTRWVEHWRSEAGRLLGELQVVLLHEIRGFKDRRRAFNEVIQYVRSKDASYRRIAEAAVKRDFKLKKLKAGVPDDSWETFETAVENTASEVME